MNSIPDNLIGGDNQFMSSIVEALHHRVGKNESAATEHDWLTATNYALRDKLVTAGSNRPGGLTSAAASGSIISASNS
jgi:hypothetical protein